MRKHHLRHLCYAAALTLVVAACSSPKQTARSRSASEAAQRSFFSAFADSLEKGLDKTQYGYSIAIYSGSELVLNRSAGQRSKDVDTDGAQPFTNTTRIHIASLSKTITSMATLELLQEKGITLADSVYKYLPPHWSFSSTFKTITFHQLLTHTSGLRHTDGSCNNADANTYSSLRTLAERPIEPSKTYCYQNANFGLLRIVLPAINGLAFSGNDKQDDASTQQGYEQLVQRLVFDKSGIANALCEWQPGYALLYDYPYTGRQGFNAGKLTGRAGGLGWYLTANELAKVLSHLSTPADESILPNNWKDSLLQKGYGCYATATTKGTAYWHDGIWHWSPNGQVPQGMRSLWMKLPYQNLTVVLLVNALREQGHTPAFPVAHTGIVNYVVSAFNAAVKKG
jgi:CubicO group peptidase (beta-lactamase class C family)